MQSAASTEFRCCNSAAWAENLTSLSNYLVGNLNASTPLARHGAASVQTVYSSVCCRTMATFQNRPSTNHYAILEVTPETQNDASSCEFNLHQCQPSFAACDDAASKSCALSPRLRHGVDANTAKRSYHVTGKILHEMEAADPDSKGSLASVSQKTLRR